MSQAIKEWVASTFNKRAGLRGMVIGLSFLLFSLRGFYISKCNEVDKIAMKKLGMKMCSELSYSDIMGDDYWPVIYIICIAAFGVMLLTVVAIKIFQQRYNQEAHLGWKRVFVTLSTVLFGYFVLQASLHNVYDFVAAAIVSAIASIFVLGLTISSIRWVLEGFSGNASTK